MSSPVHISTMSGKLEGFKAISTNTLTNNFCVKMNTAKKETICSHCYSHSMLKGYRKNTAPALQRNSDLLSSHYLFDDEVPKIKDKYFRFSSHGELINYIHLCNLVKIAEFNPDTSFALWTKRKDLVNHYLKNHGMFPLNMILIYSNPEINKVMAAPPKGFDRTFNNVTSHPDENCTGQKCKDCLLCYTVGNNVTTIIEKVK